MRRSLMTFGFVIASFALTAPVAWAIHGPGGSSTTSSGFPWHTVLVWGCIGVAIVLAVVWTVVEGRRHHWHMPHRPAHA
jgi:hypothetical protein